MQHLVELAFDDPDAASRTAENLLATSDDAVERSWALQCLGIVHREAGRLDESVAVLRLGLGEARRAREVDRICDLRSTLGITLVFGGRTRSGLRQLAQAVIADSDRVVAKALMLQAMGFGYAGRFDDARTSLHLSLVRVRAAGDRLWEARTLNNLAHVDLRLGLVAEAERSVALAERLFRREGAEVEALDAIANLADIAACRGDFAAALRWYRLAGAADSSGVRPELAERWVSAMRAAGLADEAVALLREVLSKDSQARAKTAELRLAMAEALLAAGRPDDALVAARRARDDFRAQHREWHRLRAQLALIRSQAALSGRPGRGATGVALQLHAQGADEAPLALILAGRAAEGEERMQLWRQALSYRTRANGLVRASAHLAGALEREACGDRGGVLGACSLGLNAIDEHRRLMGSSELRALATTHGRELTEIALRHAAHDPRTLLRWSERTRATALAQPPATSDAATIPASLAALRDNGRRLAEARQAGEPTEDLEKERLRLERAVRTESHTQSAADTDPQRPASAEEIVAGVADGCLVELVDVDGTLHVLVVHNGRVRRRVAGTVAEVNDLLGPASMLLRRASRGRPANTADVGRRLQEAILGDAVRLIPDGSLTLSPTARLHGLAWSLLPTLHDRPFSVVPSAGQWLRAREVRRPTPRRTLLVAGPDLESGGAEVPVLAQRLAGAVLLDGPQATVTDVLKSLDGADLAHLATHGRFRADSPLFSSLDLADGPLTVHDLERLSTAPYRVVLSACESGVQAPVGAQELLGLAAALFSIGTAGLVCSVAEVNDAATAGLMVGLHDGLARGDDPATALLHVRRAAATDPVAAGTAAAFVALGV